MGNIVELEGEAVGDNEGYLEVGEVVEEATPEVFFNNPSHERTRRFLDQIL